MNSVDEFKSRKCKSKIFKGPGALTSEEADSCVSKAESTWEETWEGYDEDALFLRKGRKASGQKKVQVQVV